jgi:hypothetical protein
VEEGPFTVMEGQGPTSAVQVGTQLFPVTPPAWLAPGNYTATIDRQSGLAAWIVDDAGVQVWPPLSDDE